MTLFKVYEVGGAVRDRLMGLDPHDIDFAIETESYERMNFILEELGFEIFLKTPEFLTSRARFPKAPTADWIIQEYIGKTCDFVLTRRDGNYSDGRHPDEVKLGSIYDDLARRDFTVNAMAIERPSGRVYDPHNGQIALHAKILSCVGSASKRLEEDALRALRAIRFKITKGFSLDIDLQLALYSEWIVPLLADVEVNRRREELYKCFKYSTIATLEALESYLSSRALEAIFDDDLWLMPTLKKK